MNIGDFVIAKACRSGCDIKTGDSLYGRITQLTFSQRDKGLICIISTARKAMPLVGIFKDEILGIIPAEKIILRLLNEPRT